MITEASSADLVCLQKRNTPICFVFVRSIRSLASLMLWCRPNPSRHALMTTTMNATSSSILFTSRNAGSALIATSFFTASDVEKNPPTKNSSVATTNEARYLARYRPNGWSPSVLRLEKRPPTINTISLEQSAMECTDSESMADDPVKNAAHSFAMATPMFAPNAALTAAP